MTEVTLRYFDGCPNWEYTDHQLRELRAEVGFELGYERVATHDEAERLGFAGSPTVLVDGADRFATGRAASGLVCRVYMTPEGLQGSPTLEQLRAVLA